MSEVQVDDHVVLHWRRGRGINASPPVYQAGGGLRVGGGWVTTFNKLAVVSENRLTPISKTVSFPIAALMGCAVTTGLGVITHEARVKIGQSVAVFGCGGVGLNIIQGAALASAYPVIGVDLHPDKLKLAREFGATHTTVHVASIQKWCPAGVDVCVDTTGIPRVIEQAFELTAPSGCLHLVAQVRHDHTINLQTLPMHAGKTLIASDGGHTDPAVDIPRYLKLFEVGRLKLDQLITHRAPLSAVNYLIDENHSPAEIKQTFRGDKDIKEALSYFLESPSDGLYHADIEDH